VKTNTSTILFALFATISSLNAAELIAVSAVSGTGGPEYIQIAWTGANEAQKFYMSKIPIITTGDVQFISIGEDPLIVIVDLTPDGRTKAKKGTADMSGKRMAVLVNGRVQEVPLLLQAPWNGQLHIPFKKPEEAKALVDAFTNKKG
jgi:hypothetical protein